MVKIKNPWFYNLNQTKESNLIFDQIDLSWLHSFDNDDSIFYLINIKCADIEVPDGKDLYIFSWFFETFVDQWFLSIYNRNPQAEFVIITDLCPNGLHDLPRVSTFKVYHHSTWMRAIKQVNDGPAIKSLKDRKYKISALSSRLSEFKFYITAKLLDKQDAATLYSWNRGFEVRDKDSFIFELSNYQNADRILKKHREILKNQTINADDWLNNPLNNCRFDHAAYQDSLINCINETQNISKTPEFGTLPVPYLTEKTWKPLFAGNALLLSGQASIKKTLEGFGFRLDYPWAQNCDDDFYDMQRCETLLNHIDWILSLDSETLVSLCHDSVQHNIELAWSGKVECFFDEYNQESIQLLKEHLSS